MIWIFLIFCCSFRLLMVGMGEVGVSMLWIVRDVLTELLGARIAALVLLLALAGGVIWLLQRPPEPEAPIAVRLSASKCGTGTAPRGIEPLLWSSYTCHASRAANCLAWNRYTSYLDDACPGVELCCSPKVADHGGE